MDLNDQNCVDRYCSAYWSEMIRLQETHATLYAKLLVDGSWTAQRAEEKPFTSVSADQAIEQTVNRGCKTSGGLKRLTPSRGEISCFCSNVLETLTFTVMLQ